jgi:hypothetical protein
MGMCKILHDEKYSEAVETIPHTNFTVTRRAESVSEGTSEYLQTRVKCFPKFSFQISESRDVA